MKKSILLSIVFLLIAISVTSCNSEEKDSVPTGDAGNVTIRGSSSST